MSPRCLGPSRSTLEGCGAAHGPCHPAYVLLLGLAGSGLFRLMSFLGSGCARCCLLGSKNSLLALFAQMMAVVLSLSAKSANGLGLSL